MPNKIYQLIIGGIRNDIPVFFLYLSSFIVGSKPCKIAVMDEEVLKNKVSMGKSLIRLGDGEVMLMMGRDIHFQPTNNELVNNLRRIIFNYKNDSRYCLGIPTEQVLSSESELKTLQRLRIWRLFRSFVKKRFPKNVEYYSAVIFYHQGKFEKIISPQLIGKNIICVSRAEILDNTLSKYLEKFSPNISFVTVPDKNAFSVIEETKKQIYEIIERKPQTKPIILLAAGPASKVMAFDLCTSGIQAIDVGHGMEILGRNLDYSTRI